MSTTDHPTSPRQRRTTRAVAVISGIVLLVCVEWAQLVQDARPDACHVRTPPPRAQCLHC